MSFSKNYRSSALFIVSITVFASLSLAPAIALSATSDLAFDKALSTAKADESTVTGLSQADLEKAKSAVVLSALSACSPRQLAKPSDSVFVVVAKLDESGKVTQTWRQGDSDLAKCFEKQVGAAKILSQWRPTFYIYFPVNQGS